MHGGVQVKVRRIGERLPSARRAYQLDAAAPQLRPPLRVLGEQFVEAPLRRVVEQPDCLQVRLPMEGVGHHAREPAQPVLPSRLRGDPVGGRRAARDGVPELRGDAVGAGELGGPGDAAGRYVARTVPSQYAIRGPVPAVRAELGQERQAQRSAGIHTGGQLELATGVDPNCHLLHGDRRERLIADGEDVDVGAHPPRW